MVAVDDSDGLVEVVIAWGESVLHVAHLRSAHASFSIGERGTFAMPSERIGHARLELVRGRTAFVPDGVRGQVAFGEETLSLADARARGRIEEGRLSLVRGVRTRFELGGFVVQIAMVGRSEKLAGKGAQRRLTPWVVAVLLHVGTLSTLASSAGQRDEGEAASPTGIEARQVLLTTEPARTAEAPQVPSTTGSPAPASTGAPLEAPSPTPICAAIDANGPLATAAASTLGAALAVLPRTAAATCALTPP